LLTENNLVFIGKITRPHGVHGELKLLEGLASSGAWRQAPELWLGADRHTAQPWKVARVRGAGKFAIVDFVDVSGMKPAKALCGKQVFVQRKYLPAADEDSYYPDDLIGFSVEDKGGRTIGKVVEIFDNGAHEVYTIVAKERQVMLPAVPNVVIRIDFENRLIVVDPPAGIPGLSSLL
jgi:16S rRNA processing protein RimM